MKTFAFLVGSERSGTNFVTSLMNAHSSVCGPSPTHLFRLFASNRGNYGDLENESHWEALSEDMARAFASQLGAWRTSATARELRDLVRERTVAGMLRFIYEREAAASGDASHVFVKENHTYRFAPFLMEHFDPRFVLIVRDPRDVASSWLMTRSIPGGVAKAADVWLRDQEGGLALYDQLRDSGRCLLIRYEELVRDAEATCRRLTEHLGLQYEESMLGFNEDALTRENAKRIEAWGNLSRPVLTENTEKFRSVLTSTDQRYVELVCGELMERLGYRRELEAGDLDAARRDVAIAELARKVQTGEHEVAAEQERKIRALRRESIERVSSRRLEG